MSPILPVTLAAIRAAAAIEGVVLKTPMRTISAPGWRLRGSICRDETLLPVEINA